TAGVYMIARLHAVYALAPAALMVVAAVGAATALFAAVIATAQTDIKRVLAYSTVSQLGYMFLGLGVGATGAAIFHLVTHAFFKGRLLCLTFLGVSRVSPEAAHHLHESPPVMTVPLAVLAVGAFAGGLLPVPAIVGQTGEAEAPLALMALATGLAAAGLGLA